MNSPLSQRRAVPSRPGADHRGRADHLGASWRCWSWAASLVTRRLSLDPVGDPGGS